MQPATQIQIELTIWWSRYSGFLIIGLVSLFAASFATWQWGSPLTYLRRRNMLGLRQKGRARAEDTFWIRWGNEGFRFLGNPPLVAGALIVSILLFASVAPGVLAPFDPEEQGRILQTFDGEVMVAPFPPNSKYLMGADSRARDMLSRVIYGTRRTLTIALAVALLRLTIGGLLGGVAGMSRGPLGQQILSLASVSASIPSLLFAYMFINAIGPQMGFGVFILGLGLTGWAEMTNLVNGSVRWVRSQPFMEGAVAIGSSPLHIIRRHLLPNIAPQLIPATAQELSAVVLTLAELGFLGLFLGERVGELVSQEIRVPKIPEWAGMLSGARVAIFQWPWLSLTPALAVTVAILGFNLLGIGLRGWLDPYKSRPSTFK